MFPWTIYVLLRHNATLFQNTVSIILGYASREPQWHMREIMINMHNIIIYVAWWREKDLLKDSVTKTFYPWHEKLITVWTLSRQTKRIFFDVILLRDCSYGGELAELGVLGHLGEISSSLRNPYKNMRSYQKWASAPRWDLTWFCWNPT